MRRRRRARKRTQFASARIPESINWPMSRFDPSRLPSDKPVVLICHSGMRSRSALSKAQAAGRQDVKHYAGGIVGWHSRKGALAL